MNDKFLHKRSSVKGKYPTDNGTKNGKSILEIGEIAINFTKGNEFLAITNSENGVTEFKPIIDNGDGNKFLNDKGEYVFPKSNTYVYNQQNDPNAATLDKELIDSIDILNELKDGRQIYNLESGATWAFVDTLKPYDPNNIIDLEGIKEWQRIITDNNVFYRTNKGKFSKVLYSEDIQGYKEITDLDNTLEPYGYYSDKIEGIEYSCVDWIVRTITNLNMHAVDNSPFRYQIAMPMEVGGLCKVYIRYHDDTVWGSWRKVAISNPDLTDAENKFLNAKGEYKKINANLNVDLISNEDINKLFS